MLRHIRKNRAFRAVSLAVVFAFIALDMTWAYPEPFPADKLSPQTNFGAGLLTTDLEALQNPLVNNAPLLFTVFDIAK